MFNTEAMDDLVKKAKKQLEGQVEEAKATNNEEVSEETYDGEDIYAEFREDNEDIYADLREEGVDIKSTFDPNDYADTPKIDTNPENAFNYGSHDEEDSLVDGDYRIFANGPFYSQVNSWKKQWENGKVFVVNLDERTFVFRTLQRFEYKQIVSQLNTDALQREEVICETVVLWPDNYTWKVMATQDAGLPSSLAEVIMEKSGFTKDYAIKVL